MADHDGLDERLGQEGCETSRDSIPTFLGYLSDISDDDGIEGDRESENEDPPAKRTKTDSTRAIRLQARAARRKELVLALNNIETMISSKRTVFSAGHNGLQSYRAHAIQSHLRMVVNNNRTHTQASEIAAEGQGFARTWGGRMVRSWVRRWVKDRELPQSMKGRNVKTFTLLDDPTTCAELRAFVRSNKWSMNPEKLAEFSKNNLITREAEKYVRQVIESEMPRGLKQYMDLELFPRIHLKVGRGISLQTARRWLHREGFQYIEHKKSLYYDGHDRPDVVEYRQHHFLPAMA